MGWFAEYETPAGQERLRAKTESEARSFAGYLDERGLQDEAEFEEESCEFCTHNKFCWSSLPAVECEKFEDIR